MNSNPNRNIIIVVIAAIVVAGITAGALFIFNRGDSENTPASGSTTALRLMTPAPVDSKKLSTAEDNVVAAVASKGKARVIVEVETNLSPNASAQDEVRAIASSQDNVLASTGGSVNVVHRLTRFPMLVLEVDETAARSLASSSSVRAMQLDRDLDIDLSDTIPAIGAPTVWENGASGQGVAIAIMDTGVEADHPFLGGRVVHEVCFSGTWTDYGVTTLCPNGEEFQEGPGASDGCDETEMGGCNHGTHVAGIAAGNYGVAPDASIIGIQVFSRFTDCGAAESPCVRAPTSNQIRALEWILENAERYNIASVNISIGGGSYSDQAECDAAEAAYKSAVDRVVAANVAVVLSAGNDSETAATGAPGCISPGIAVGSMTKSDGVSDFSNSSDLTDIFAYGSSINSSVKGGAYDTMSGTSMASPHVAGAFALLRSAAPDATVQQLFSALSTNGSTFTDPRNGLTFPRLQADAAYNALKGGARPEPTPRPRPNPTTAPANDDEANAVQITSPNFRHTVDTRNATLYDDPAIRPTYYCPEGGYYDKTVWYEFTAPSNGYLTVSTQGSSYDTIMSVWQGSRGYAWMVGCNDDDDYYGGVYTSTIGGWVAKGASFRIQVAAWDNGGTLVLSAAFQGSNTSSQVTDSNIAPVVFDAKLSEAPSDLAGNRANSEPPRPANCGARPARPADLKGECFRGPAPQ